jgi:two-component system nitrate/nitrite sensor histidine kinase NarX
MKFSLNKQSLLLHIGAAMASIVVLALVSMLSSMFIAETSKGYAAAINQAGTLRMQSYRISTSLVQADEDELWQTVNTTQALADEFRRRLFSERIHKVLDKGSSEAVRQAYQDVEREWQQVMLPMLQEYIGNALAAQNRKYPKSHLVDLRRLYLGKVDGFVNRVHRFVRALEDEAEGKINQLQVMQIIVMLLTLTAVGIILITMKRNLVNPLRELLVFARRVSQGDFSMRNRPRREDELGQLGRAFNLMAEDLSKIYQDLEQRVKEKTADLERSNRSLELLYATTKQLGENPLNEATLQDLIKIIERVIGVTGGAVCLGEVGDPQAYRMATTLGSQQGMANGCDMPDCLQCFGSGDAHSISLADLQPGQAQRYSVPIEDQHQQFGVLILDLPRGVELADWQKLLLDTVASHIALSIVRARQVSQNRLLSLMEERSVIARELHDSLAQSLSYLKIQVSLLEKSLADHGDPKVQQTTGKLRDGLNSAYRELRELLTTFRLRMTEEGLVRALEDTVREFSERGNIPISLHNNIGNVIFSPNEEIHMVQIVREALSNVVRHSRASHARVELNSNMEGEVEIVIEDDGVGMPEVNRLEHHYGMAIMRERTQGLGGNLHVGTSALGGTAVKLFFQASPSAHA